MNADVRRTVGQIVRKAMAERGRTQQEVALALRISQAQVSRRLSDRIAFNVGELRIVAALLGVRIEALIPETEPAPTP